MIEGKKAIVVLDDDECPIAVLLVDENLRDDDIYENIDATLEGVEGHCENTLGEMLKGVDFECQEISLLAVYID